MENLGSDLMKIGINVNKVMNVYNQGSKIDKNSNTKQKSSDTIELSQTGKDFAKYIEIAKNSDMENSKVDEIKKLIEKGDYKVDSSKLAKSLVDFMKERDV